MAFANGYQGDVETLNIIIQTLNAKTYIIPGVTVSHNVQVSAEIINYYTRSTTAGRKGALGGKVDFKSKGVKRIALPITEGYIMETVIPNVNATTVTPAVIQDKVAQETLTAANTINEDLVTALWDGAEEITVTPGKTYLKLLLNAVDKFKLDNKANALTVTGILVAPNVISGLTEESKAHVTQPGTIGGELLRVFNVAGIGAPIIECLELDENQIILINGEGVIHGININSLFVVDATTAGYPGGTLITGEIGYEEAVVTRDDDVTLGTGYLVAKATIALEV